MDRSNGWEKDCLAQNQAMNKISGRILDKDAKPIRVNPVIQTTQGPLFVGHF